MFWRRFLAPPTLTFSIAMSIYCQMTVNITFKFNISMNFISIVENAIFSLQMGYPAGYGSAVNCYVQMVVICFIGQNVLDRVNFVFASS